MPQRFSEEIWERMVAVRPLLLLATINIIRLHVDHIYKLASRHHLHQQYKSSRQESITLLKAGMDFYAPAYTDIEWTTT